MHDGVCVSSDSGSHVAVPVVQHETMLMELLCSRRKTFWSTWSAGEFYYAEHNHIDAFHPCCEHEEQTHTTRTNDNMKAHDVAGMLLVRWPGPLSKQNEKQTQTQNQFWL